MPTRRLRKHPAELDISAFLNLIVVLVPFLLSTAVFTRLSVLDLTLPAQSSGVEQVKDGNLLLEVVIRGNVLEVGDRNGGLIERIPAAADGPDIKALSAQIHRLKLQFPDKNEATVLAEPNTPYQVLVRVMDAVRAGKSAKGGTTVVPIDLFPRISVGDAPVSAPGGAPASAPK
ncbi:MAG TPA: biopolymer transporter ExbD [Burkholderiaceae bacterium]|nr:biopolymer transporter ExbD [Burkholderiaceae bacterium]